MFGWSLKVPGQALTDTIYAGDLKLHVEMILRRESLVPETSFHIGLVFNGKVLRHDFRPPSKKIRRNRVAMRSNHGMGPGFMPVARL